MKKTDTFFVIHNYNTVPTELLEYCENYVIYDASDQKKTREEMDALGISYIPVPNTGHNITSYFSFFMEQYDTLPEVMCLCKGNMIGRHCSKEYFDKVYQNKYFTYLYEEREKENFYSKTGAGEKSELAFWVTESQYVEKNTSWYAGSDEHPKRYFDDFDRLLSFIYKNPVIPQYCLFAPGACYIVRREQIQKNTPVFYKNLNKLMSYGMNPSFPSEAHQIERMLPIIFESSYKVNEWMNDEDEFDKKILSEEQRMIRKAQWNQKRLKRVRILLGQKPKDL